MLRRFFMLGLILVTACGMAGNLRQGVDMTVVNERLLLNGEITSRTPAVLNEVLAQNPQVTTIVLQQMQGSIDDEAVLAIGYRIRELGLWTHLQSDSGIYSGAVNLFLGGTRRTMVRGAEVGVHSWADTFGEGTNYPRDASEHQANARYAADMLGSDAFYWFTLEASPSSGIYIMTREDIARFGLLTAPVIEF